MRDQQVIIVEGPDRVGKTHIVDFLSNKLEIPKFKRNLKGFSEYDFFDEPDAFANAVKYDQTYIVDFLRQTECSVIFDRSYPSEWVYSKVFKRKSEELLLELIDHEFSLLNTKLIVCLKENYGKYQDKIEAVNENILEIDKMYNRFSNWTYCDNLVLYTDNEDINLQWEILEGFVT